MTERRGTPQLLTGAELNAALHAVGMRLGGGGEVAEPPSPELTVVSAVAEALPSDYRLLGVATVWLGVHGPRLHVSELVRLLPLGEKACSDRVRYRAYWAAIAHWLGKDNRWAKVARMYRGKRVHLSLLGADVAELAIERRGHDPRFAGSRLRVPEGMLRDRAADVDPPEVMAIKHPWYRERVRQGPTYRADCWAELSRRAEVTPAQLARRVGCTYPIAHRAVQDWKLLATQP